MRATLTPKQTRIKFQYPNLILIKITTMFLKFSFLPLFILRSRTPITLNSGKIDMQSYRSPTDLSTHSKIIRLCLKLESHTACNPTKGLVHYFNTRLAKVSRSTNRTGVIVKLGQKYLKSYLMLKVFNYIKAKAGCRCKDLMQECCLKLGYKIEK